MSTVPKAVDTQSPTLHSPSRNQKGFVTVAFKWGERQGSERFYRAAEAVEELMSHPGWEAVQAVLEAAGETVQADLFKTIGSNQAAAAQAAGHLQGLKGSQIAAQSILAAAESMRTQLENAAEAAREKA